MDFKFVPVTLPVLTLILNSLTDTPIYMKPFCTLSHFKERFYININPKESQQFEFPFTYPRLLKNTEKDWQ